MSCSICGADGHNSRTCPNNKKENNHALWVKFDNISEEDADELLKNIIDVKRKVAPEARAAYAKADRRQLPSRIKEALQLPKVEDNDE